MKKTDGEQNHEKVTISICLDHDCVIISKLESHQLQKREPLRIAGLGAIRRHLSENNIWK